MNVALVCLFVTIALYFLNKKLHVLYPKFWLAPIVLTPVLIVLWVVFSRIAYAEYARYTSGLIWMLGPATVAFAVPIYEHRVLLRRNLVALIVGTLTGIVVSLTSAWALARLMHLPPELSQTLLVRSISTPFAIVLSPQLGGSSELAALLVVLTGVFGMLIGETFLAWLPLSNSGATIGTAVGAAAHAVGTARAHQLGSEEGVMASLTMVFSGVVMVLAGPWLARIFT